MTDKIKIDIVSDVMCPWCIIGYKRIEKAIRELELEDKIQIEWNPFELNPNMPKEGENLLEHLTKKYGMSQSKGKESQEFLTKLGKELDFDFNFYEDMRIVNTRDAHILLDFAKEFEKQTELKLALFKAHFSEKIDVSKKENLLDICQSINLDSTKALEKLNDDNIRDEIANKESKVHSLGISSVPTMIFNNSTRLTGAQDLDSYKKVLLDLIK